MDTYDPANVSTLVLMDSWIKTRLVPRLSAPQESFNPCFNGFMDKDIGAGTAGFCGSKVSTLVLMDSWIKT